MKRKISMKQKISILYRFLHIETSGNKCNQKHLVSIKAQGISITPQLYFYIGWRGTGIHWLCAIVNTTTTT